MGREKQLQSNWGTPKMRTVKTLAALGLLLVACTLAACGGGGGGSAAQPGTSSGATAHWDEMTWDEGQWQ